MMQKSNSKIISQKEITIKEKNNKQFSSKDVAVLHKNIDLILTNEMITALISLYILMIHCAKNKRREIFFLLVNNN